MAKMPSQLGGFNPDSASRRRQDRNTVADTEGRFITQDLPAGAVPVSRSKRDDGCVHHVLARRFLEPGIHSSQVAIRSSAKQFDEFLVKLAGPWIESSRGARLQAMTRAPQRARFSVVRIGAAVSLQCDELDLKLTGRTDTPI